MQRSDLMRAAGIVGGAPPSAQLLRSWLDEYGLKAAGQHGFVPPTQSAEDIARWHQTLDFAETLGMRHVGTGNDPTRSRYRDGRRGARRDSAAPTNCCRG